LIGTVKEAGIPRGGGGLEVRRSPRITGTDKRIIANLPRLGIEVVRPTVILRLLPKLIDIACRLGPPRIKVEGDSSPTVTPRVLPRPSIAGPSTGIKNSFPRESFFLLPTGHSKEIWTDADRVESDVLFLSLFLLIDVCTWKMGVITPRREFPDSRNCTWHSLTPFSSSRLLAVMPVFPI
jgi:hypothetical protein